MTIYTNVNDGKSYWATWGHADLLPLLMDKIDDYFKKLEKDGVLSLWQDVENCYYNYEDGEHVGSKIKFHGTGGEVVAVRSAIFRNMITHMLSGITNQQPQYIPVAANDDFDTKSQVYACKNILEHYYDSKNMQQTFRETCIYSILNGIGYTVQTWDKYAKDLVINSYGPRRVVTDLQSFHSPKWFIVIERVNKWDIAAKYEVTNIDDISNNNIASDLTSAYSGYLFDETSDNDDYIDLFYFYHDRTPALPYGRYVVFCNDNVEFTSNTKEILPYNFMPVHMMLPDKILNSPYGYSPAFDIISYNKLYDASLSTIYTQLDNARTIIGVPADASDPMPAENDPHLTIVKYPTDRQHVGIQTVNTYNVPDGIFRTMEIIKKNIIDTVGQNSTTMGESEARSGTHAALLHTVAQQFSAPFLTTFVKHIEEVGTAQIHIIRNYVDDPVMLKITGSDKEVYLQAFRGDDISNMKSTSVKAVSPMLSTQSGRLTIAQDLMKMPNSGFGPKDYIGVLDNGQLDSSFTDPRDEDMTLSLERDMLSAYSKLTVSLETLTAFDGESHQVEVVEQVRALITDNHQEHMMHHCKLLSSPKARQNPDLVRIIRIHISEHIWLSKYGNRDLLLASGQKPMPDMNSISPGGSLQRNMQGPDMTDTRLINPKQLPGNPNMPVAPRLPDNELKQQQQVEMPAV